MEIQILLKFYLYFSILGITINGLLHCLITTIERRFHLHSNETGLVSAGYDIASLICLIPVSYLGGRPNSCKPHWIGYGLIVFGIGSLISSLPHLLVKPEYKVEQDYLLLCNVTAGNSQNPEVSMILLCNF